MSSRHVVSGSLRDGTHQLISDLLFVKHRKLKNIGRRTNGSETGGSVIESMGFSTALTRRTDIASRLINASATPKRDPKMRSSSARRAWRVRGFLLRAQCGGGAERRGRRARALGSFCPGCGGIAPARSRRSRAFVWTPPAAALLGGEFAGKHRRPEPDRRPGCSPRTR
jgi:hypothetical protein